MTGEKAVITRTHLFLDGVKYGWDRYSFIFFIGGVSVIIGGLFGISGFLALILTLAFFYYAGKAHKRLDATSKEVKVYE